MLGNVFDNLAVFTRPLRKLNVWLYLYGWLKQTYSTVDSWLHGLPRPIWPLSREDLVLVLRAARPVDIFCLKYWNLCIQIKFQECSRLIGCCKLKFFNFVIFIKQHEINNIQYILKSNKLSENCGQSRKATINSIRLYEYTVYQYLLVELFEYEY